VRGVALLIVLVVLVLIATLATEIAVTSRTYYRAADRSMESLLLRSAVDGRAQILLAALRYDGTNGSGYDGEADEWSWHNHERLSDWGTRAAGTTDVAESSETSAVAGYSNTQVELTAWCEDERAKLNLRGLMKPEDSPVFVNTRETLVRLIDLYRDGTSALDLSDSDAREMVEDLVKWLQAEADTDENPMPAVKPNRGRLQSLDDLVRVPGGHWTPERLYDVRDPNATDEEGSADSSASDDASSDSAWMRPNGVAGLARYLTVFAEDANDPPMRINVNTAPVTLLRALLDPNDEDLAQKIADHRREGADESTSSTSSADTSGTAGSTDQTTVKFFKNKSDLKNVEGMDADLAKYPRLNFFADVASNVFSLRVVAKVVKRGAGDVESAGEDEDAPREISSVYDYRQVVQRTQAGKEFLTLFVERRSDPLYER
jgi:type II secretory pathway component PulK